MGLSSIEHCWWRQWLWRRTIFVILDAWVSRQAGHLNKRITNDGRSLTNRRRSTIGNILFESTGTRGKWRTRASQWWKCVDFANMSWMFNVVPLTFCINTLPLQPHRIWPSKKLCQNIIWSTIYVYDLNILILSHCNSKYILAKYNSLYVYVVNKKIYYCYVSKRYIAIILKGLK